MKIKITYTIAITILLLILVSCTKEELNSDQQKLKSLCNEKFSAGSWMHMNEMAKGQIAGPACWGCMTDMENHVCDLKNMPVDMNAQASVSVELSTLPEILKANQSANLFFTFADNEKNPITDFTISHEKLIHAIIVNDDFSIFSHLHPEDNVITTNTMKEKGIYGLNYNFVKQGKYIISLDFEIGNNHLSRQFLVGVENKNENKLNLDFSNIKKFREYEVEFSVPKNLKSGEESILEYLFKKQGSEITDLQPYLAAPMHIAIIKSDLSKFIHTHGILSDEMVLTVRAAHEGHSLPAKFGPKISANIIFPEKGIYQIFSEVKHEGKVLVASFMVNVKD